MAVRALIKPIDLTASANRASPDRPAKLTSTNAVLSRAETVRLASTVKIVMTATAEPVSLVFSVKPITTNVHRIRVGMVVCVWTVLTVGTAIVSPDITVCFVKLIRMTAPQYRVAIRPLASTV